MRVLAGAAVLLGAIAPPLTAQFKSVPVYAITAARPGWAVALDFGAGLNDASGHARHVGGRVAGALGSVRLTAGGGVWDAGSSTTAQLGGTAAVRLAGGAQRPLTVLAVGGVGSTHSGPSDTAATYWTFPVGVALIRPGLGPRRRAITPWLFPRVQVDRVSFAGARANQLGVGLSAGVSADLTGRLGVHGALDWLHLFRWAGTALTLEGGARATMGVGAYVRFSGSP